MFCGVYDRCSVPSNTEPRAQLAGQLPWTLRPISQSHPVHSLINFPPVKCLSHIMSKRKLETAGVDLISSITDGEAGAMREILQHPPPELKTLAPLLERLTALCEIRSQPPHKKAVIPVRAICRISFPILPPDALAELMFIDPRSDRF